MATYLQADRPLRIKTKLGENQLLLAAFTGTEAISRPYRFRLDLMSEDPGIDGIDLVNSPVTITVALPAGETREIHGVIFRFAQLGQTEDRTLYRAEIVPHLFYLTLTQNCRIFQHKTAVQIIEAVLKERGVDYALKCNAPHPQRDFCVQYRESDFDFVSRLMEEEGIFYFFDHSGSKESMVLADRNAALAACPNQTKARIMEQPLLDEDVLFAFEREYRAHVGKVELKDFDPLQPSLSLRLSAQTQQKAGLGEAYDYPGFYTTNEEGDRRAKLRIEAAEMAHELGRGRGNCRAFVAGYKVTVEGHFGGANQEYLLTEIQHAARGADYRAGSDSAFEYTNEFVAIPAAVPYRPERTTRKPVIAGSQTAIVVGPGGEEIYVDEHGRVKVQFHWDREGKRDENSSCWVRVSSAWAGKGWGAVNPPRIGQEVIVDFLEGDPDRPIITGRVYNAEQTPPYGVPDTKNQSGIKSRSTKGGGADDYNEIRMDDTKGSELFVVHAQKDKQVTVENNRTESVGNNESISIGNDRSESVGNNETITIEANRSTTIGKSETISVGENRSQTVSQNEQVDIGGDRTQVVAKKETINVGDKRTTDIGADDALTVAKKLTVDAGDEILLKTGEASILLKKDGTITIKGKDIKIEGSGKINVKASGDVVVKGSKVQAN
ncbi:MAG TPA: type VI secretion system tip protein TssI/VgrG [Longimicrobiales bacterium]|nr:type VI secretion system tip protein TssI/VgrG [Longimicrobiales bacterium]